jgi:hypothetical protein
MWLTAQNKWMKVKNMYLPEWDIIINKSEIVQENNTPVVVYSTTSSSKWDILICESKSDMHYHAFLKQRKGQSSTKNTIF